MDKSTQYELFCALTMLALSASLEEHGITDAAIHDDLLGGTKLALDKAYELGTKYVA